MAAPSAVPKMGRLATLNKPRIGPRIPPRGQPPTQGGRRPNVKPGGVTPCCAEPKLEMDDDVKVCLNCGTTISESNIVADVTFQEDSRGATSVQGGYVSENARHARSIGTGAFRRVGGGERNSILDVENNGRRALQNICPKLGIPENIANQAAMIFGLAAKSNFNSGRRSEEVVAACLFAACRRQKENTILLMDLAEFQKINVFRLGEVYKDLLNHLFLTKDDPGYQHIVDVEPLIMKYCRRLQFQEKTKQVAEDACKIIRRMKRDWIVPGRHPAGLCGASIILAARMNNFRRTIREVVFVARVADVTITKRMEEFRRTRSAGMTVEQFRKYGPQLKHQHDPPSMMEADIRAEKLAAKKRKREEYHSRRESMASDSVIDIPDDVTEASSRQSSVAAEEPAQEEGGRASKRQKTQATGSEEASPQQEASASPEPQPTGRVTRKRKQTAAMSTPESSATEPASQETAGSEGSQRPAKRTKTADSLPTPVATQEPRYDADGFAIPALPGVLPIDPALIDDPTAVAVKRGRGRPRKADAPPPVVITEEELEEEDLLELEIEESLDNQELVGSSDELKRLKIIEHSKTLADQQRESTAKSNQERRDAAGTNYWGDTPEGDTLGAEELELEFENDPEVNGCLLSENEARIKEQIWLVENEGWLRNQYQKDLKKKMAAIEASTGRGKGAKGGKKGKGKKGKKGNGLSLTDPDTPAETPAEASAKMLEEFAPANVSNFLDMTRLEKLYRPGRGTPDSEMGSRASSVAPSITAAPRRQSTSDSTAHGAGEAESPAPERRVHFAATSPAPADATAGAEEEEGDDAEEAGGEAAASQQPAFKPYQDADTYEDFDDDDEPVDDDDGERDYADAADAYGFGDGEDGGYEEYE